VASVAYREFINRTLAPERELGPFEVIANAYPEKRARTAGRPTSFMGRQWFPSEDAKSPRWLLGVFTPHHRKWDQEAGKAFKETLREKYNVKSLRCVRSSEGRYPNVEEVSE
jgi:hypothetical protein